MPEIGGIDDLPNFTPPAPGADTGVSPESQAALVAALDDFDSACHQLEVDEASARKTAADLQSTVETIKKGLDAVLPILTNFAAGGQAVAAAGSGLKSLLATQLKGALSGAVSKNAAPLVTNLLTSLVGKVV